MYKPSVEGLTSLEEFIAVHAAYHNEDASDEKSNRVMLDVLLDEDGETILPFDAENDHSLKWETINAAFVEGSEYWTDIDVLPF